MLRIFLLFIFLSSSAFATTINEKDKINTIDKIIVFVNKTIITSNQLNNEIALMQKTYKQKGINVPNNEEFKNNVLNQMIMLQIELGLAQKLGITATNTDIDMALHNITKAQSLTVDSFKAKLLQDDISFDTFKKQIYEQIITERLKQREVDARIAVTDDEISQVLNSEIFKHRTNYNLSYIIIGTQEHATTIDRKNKEAIAHMAYNALINGESFNQVSIRYSNAPNAMMGGELGWKSNIALPPVIVNELSKIKKDEFTSIIELPVGFLIFKINDIRKVGVVQSVKQYQVRHILIKVGENNSDEEAHQKITTIKSQLDKDTVNSTAQNEHFITLAKENSEDASGMNGGDLGWLSVGDTVPEFENMMLNTQIGNISAPFKTLFGWHILQLENIRTVDKTNDLLKSTVKQEIRDMKASLLYVEWLRSIRDGAYVKINE